MTTPHDSARLDVLYDELAGLAVATRRARATGDVEEWVRLLDRGERLPGEIAAHEHQTERTATC